MSSEDTGFPPDESATRLTEALADVDPFLSATPEDVADDLQRAFGKARVSSTSSLVTSFPAEAAEAAMFYVRPALEAKDREIARLREQVESVRADERQRIVAWLRERARQNCGPRSGQLAVAASLLEAGASAPAVDTDKGEQA